MLKMKTSVHPNHYHLLIKPFSHQRNKTASCQIQPSFLCEKKNNKLAWLCLWHIISYANLPSFHLMKEEMCGFWSEEADDFVVYFHIRCLLKGWQLLHVLDDPRVHYNRIHCFVCFGAWKWKKSIVLIKKFQWNNNRALYLPVKRQGRPFNWSGSCLGSQPFPGTAQLTHTAVCRYSFMLAATSTGHFLADN